MRTLLCLLTLIALLATPAEAITAARWRAPSFSTSEKCLPSQLRNALSYLRSHYGKVTVISSFRRGAVIAGSRKRSKHATCQAVDFYVENQEKARQWLWKQPLEVIAYKSRQFHHLHVAVGSYKGWNTGGEGGRKRKPVPSYSSLAKKKK